VSGAMAAAARGPGALPARIAQAEAELLARIRAVVAQVPDPEIPVVTLDDLGILREVLVDATDGNPVVLLTPTYSGCPATEAIAALVREALDAEGFEDVHVRTVLAPAWSSDWISEAGREKLRAWGIAPPACLSCKASAPVPSPACPRCGDSRVEAISRWGSTPCKALYRCLACREPFDYFKPY
jgi:ring-1,2-phenylacetyl-CoA epoxidase subunit PaaD